MGVSIFKKKNFFSGVKLITTVIQSVSDFINYTFLQNALDDIKYFIQGVPECILYFFIGKHFHMKGFY